MGGGEAILEAWRNLDIYYIISSPGSEWAPVWEALARQKITERDGPTYINCWHESLAVALGEPAQAPFAGESGLCLLAILADQYPKASRRAPPA